MTLPQRRVGELVARFRPRKPAPAFAAPAAPATNLAGVCHALDQAHRELLAKAGEEMPPPVREAVSKALRSIEAALDCARGGAVKELRSLSKRARAHDAALRREEGRKPSGFAGSYAKRMEGARVYLAGELETRLQTARIDLETAMEAVQRAAGGQA